MVGRGEMRKGTFPLVILEVVLQRNGSLNTKRKLSSSVSVLYPPYRFITVYIYICVYIKRGQVLLKDE